MQSAAGLGIVVTLAIVGLLTAFHEVVSGAVQQGEARRQATAARADAVWRCKALPHPRVGSNCLLQPNP
jgi:hypothetical protein